MSQLAQEPLKDGATAAPSDFPALGVGIGFRAPFRADLFMNQGGVDFLEITADHYFSPTPETEAELDLLAAHFPLVVHGLGLSLASAEGVDPGYLRRLAALVRRLRPPWWSEHISFTRAGGVEIGHLTPTPFTRESVEALCRNIATVREQIEAPLILENIAYLVSLAGAEMTEAQFLAEILERTGCGLLLDVTNLYANSVNHGYDPEVFLQALPLERIVELHFVGVRRQDGFIADSHADPTPPEIWSLMETVLARAPVKAVVLERDENLPPFAELRGELEQARALGRRYDRWV